MSIILDLQALEASEMEDKNDDDGSHLSLIGCTPHENSSLSIICG